MRAAGFQISNFTLRWDAKSCLRDDTMSSFPLETSCGWRPRQKRRRNYSLGSGFILVRTHFSPISGKLNVVRDEVDTSTLLVKVYQKHCFKKRVELVGVLPHTIGEITRKLNDGGMNNLCAKGMFLLMRSVISIRRTSSQGYLRWI